MITVSWIARIIPQAVDRLHDGFFALLGFAGPLAAQDRPRWAAARTLAHLGELTAQWLEGRIASQPGYYGPVDVDEDDAPGLTATLAALNRAGYVTTGSQAGFIGPGYDGAHWTQLAAVTGFADPATCAWLREAMTGAGYQVLAWPCKDKPWHRPGKGVIVTAREGQRVTTFGTQLGSQTIVGEIYDGVGDEAIEAVCGALQVTIYDPLPGSNELWQVLRAAAERRLDEACGWPGDTAEQRRAARAGWAEHGGVVPGARGVEDGRHG